MEKPEARKAEREITYHVGWKKGKIHYQEHPAAKTGGQVHFELKNIAERREAAAITRMLLREAPYPTGRAISILLWAVPAVAFAAVVWLVHMLRQFD